MPQPVAAANSFTAGLLSEFLATYERKYKGLSDRLAKNMAMGLAGHDRRTQTYFYWEAVPHFRRWILGQDMPESSFGGVQFEVTVREWAQSISWRFTDRQDDQTSSLVQHSRGLASSFALQDERVFFQILTAATDAALLPSIPTAPDGANLFATTAGGADRFGISGGNIRTGSGVATSGALLTDFYASRARARQFQDGQGQPLLDDDVLDGPMTIYYGAANEQVFREAFLQQLRPLAASTATSNAGISNVVLDSGHQLRLVSTQRITDNDWFIFMDNVDIKPIFSVERQPVQEVVETFENSDNVRRSGIESIRFWNRRAYGVALPYAAIQVNN